MAKQIHCSVCGLPVTNGEARYYFPTLAEEHPLAALSGIAHVECLKRKDVELSIGRQLADIRESMAQADTSERFVRDGNIILRGRLADEGKIEVYDGEDFCDFSLGSSSALKFAKSELNEIATSLLSLVANENELTYTCVRPSFSVQLEAMPATRLKELLWRFFEIPERG